MPIQPHIETQAVLIARAWKGLAVALALVAYLLGLSLVFLGAVLALLDVVATLLLALTYQVPRPGCVTTCAVIGTIGGRSLLFRSPIGIPPFMALAWYAIHALVSWQLARATKDYLSKRSTLRLHR